MSSKTLTSVAFAVAASAISASTAISRTLSANCTVSIFFLIVLINVTLSSFSSNNLSVYIWVKFKGLEKSLNSTLQKCAAERQGRVRAQQVGSVFASNH